MWKTKTLIRMGRCPADLSLRWAHSHFVGFVMRRLNYQKIGYKTRESLGKQKCMSCYFTTRTYSADSSDFFCQISMSICLNFLVLIFSVDSDWLISIKVLQTLTGNRNYFYSHQNCSNFDLVHQSGVYAIKVSQSKSIKVTWTNFDQSELTV